MPRRAAGPAARAPGPAVTYRSDAVERGDELGEVYPAVELKSKEAAGSFFPIQAIFERKRAVAGGLPGG